MDQNTFNRLSGFIFLSLGALHLCRIFYGWTAIINGWTVPLELSWVVVVVAGFLALQGFRLSQK